LVCIHGCGEDSNPMVSVACKAIFQSRLTPRFTGKI